MNRLAGLLFGFVLLSLSAFSQTQRISWADGDWKGEGYQPGFGTWSISLSVNPKKDPVFRIEYPSLSCGGSWVLEREDKGTLWFRESLSHGQSFCVENVIVAVTRLDADHITFSCFRPDTQRLSSWSTLERVK